MVNGCRIFTRKTVYTIKDNELVHMADNVEIFLKRRYDKTGYLQNGEEVKYSEKREKWVLIPRTLRRT